MILKFQIRDDLYEAYLKMAEALQSQSGKAATPEELMENQLDRFQSVNPQDRVVVVQSRDRDVLERILAGGSLRDSTDLVAKVKKLADIQLQSIRLEFTPGQLMQLKTYATKNRRDIKDVIENTVKNINGIFFDYVGA